MNQAVSVAIDEIRATFTGHQVDVEPDDQGGAFVEVHAVSIGERYTETHSWFGFRITFQYPHADVYPHYCVPGLSRRDGKALSPGIHLNHPWQTPTQITPATMLSRRSKRLDPNFDTAATKLLKVVDWLRST